MGTSSLTIAICAYNEQWNIGRLLDNLLYNQEIPSDAEIITICSGCEDKTPDVVRHFAGQDRRVKLIEEPTRLGKASAVTKILTQAKGKLVIFISADVTPQPRCVTSLVKAMADPSIGIACGRPEPVKRGRAIIKRIVDTLWSYHNWQLERLNHAGFLMHASEIFCLRGGVLNEVPLGIVNDDAFLAVVMKKLGFQIRYVPESVVRIFGPQTLTDYLRQRRRIIFGHYQVRAVTGHFSQYLFYSLLARPKFTLKMLIEYVAMNRRVLSYMAALLVEIVANLLALADNLRGKSHAIWRISPTTKTAIEV